MAEVIPNFDELLQPILGSGIKVLKYTATNLIAPGENYGSIMLAVDVKLSNDQNLYLVAKKCPTSEFIKQLFNIGVTFKKEVVLYKTIVPTLQDFQLRHNCKPISSFAKYYGSRYSMDPDKSEVDEDCCLLLENIKIQGYCIEDRMKGFNLDCTRFIIKDLARFHAVPVAIKIKEPINFRENILQHILEPNYTRESLPEDMAERFIESTMERLQKCDKYKSHAANIRKMMRESSVNFYVPNADVVEPFASLVHADYWTNNTMIKLDSNGKCVANCLVDFQLLRYGNPFGDLMFFLFSSVEIAVVKEHYDNLIDLYYQSFMDVLKELSVPGLEQFSKESCQDEINRCMKMLEMYHLLFMLTPIYTMKENATELGDLNEENLIDASKMNEEKYYERMTFVLDKFIAKGWL